VRRLAAAGVAAAAGFVALSALSPRAVGGVGVPTVVMVRDVAAGAIVGSADVSVVPRPEGQRPDEALATVADAVGRTAASPLAAREIVTPARLVGGGVLAGQPDDRVAMSVPVLDVGGLGVRPGSRIDLYATGSGRLTASDAVVLAVRDGTDGTARAGAGFGRSDPPQVTLALTPQAAGDVARNLSALEAGQIFVLAIRHTASGSQ
jgi:Flp pilus assembly protein CpaB